MDWEALHEKLAEHHFASPQNAKLAELALDGAEAAIGQLARLGHTFHLAETSALAEVRAVDEYPKMLYHSGFGQRVVEGVEGELELVKAGWRNTPEPMKEPAPAEPKAPAPELKPVAPTIAKDSTESKAKEALPAAKPTT